MVSYERRCSGIMAAKKELMRLEADIEKNREECNWERVTDLARQRFNKNQKEKDALSAFLIGEGKLESYLEKNPPSEDKYQCARGFLDEARYFLSQSIGELGVKCGVAMDAQILLAKLCYAEHKFEEALNFYSKAGLDNLTEKALPLRSLRMIAEAYSIKGRCLEKLPPPSTSKFRQAERLEQVLACYEKASNLALVYVQEVEKSFLASSSATAPTTGTTSDNPRAQLGVLLETALERAPLLLLQSGQLNRAISQYRTIMSSVQSAATRHVRLSLLKSFAQVLLRGICPQNYVPPEIVPETYDRKSTLDKNKSPWQPEKYKGANMFIPNSFQEEVILVLLIGEVLAVRETVLSRNPDHAEARQLAFETACSIYDLLSIVLVPWKEISILTELFERAMKFSFEEKHIWSQFALCLYSSGLYPRSLATLKEAIRLSPSATHLHLLAARTCFEHLNQVDEGLQHVHNALNCEREKNEEFMGRCLVYKGIGIYMKSRAQNLHQDRTKLLQEAEECFLKAAAVDEGDHLVQFYVALLAAHHRRISEAVSHVKVALSLRRDHLPSLHLLALLLSAQNDNVEALSLTEASLKEYPNSMPLMYLKAILEEKVRGPEVALLTARKMLAHWKCIFEKQNSGSNENKRQDSGLDSISLNGEMRDRDTISVTGSMAGTSHVEQALSEVASSLSSYQPKPGPQGVWLMQVTLWLLTAELYLNLKQPAVAMNCVMEANAIFPLFPSLMYMRGLIHEAKGEFEEAKQSFLNSLSIQPGHVRSLQHLGLAYLQLDSPRLAEQTLREAVRLDPFDHRVWYTLGHVLDLLEETEAACDCHAKALQLEATAPILSFSVVSLAFD
ncbi:unnamed protein product [Darwinula stevensoni]|uniref:Tetratricopeptide repeat protein 7 N-terminal domain-containing protein n=1 Tax=Darwinula stevensoni TaxID=69355 RepID=A0A7R9A2F3_9CRUS|nr:unnamed protein product [Darwinula stevensoni]CAG0879431.1 unnamed protein product [Darwinula stevensoni]